MSNAALANATSVSSSNNCQNFVFSLCCRAACGNRCHFSGMSKPGFSKPCLCLSDTRHFRHFRRFRGCDERSPCFWWVECKFVIFAVLVKTAPFWQGTKTRFTRNTVCATLNFSESAILSQVHPPSKIKSNKKFKALRWRVRRWRLTLSENRKGGVVYGHALTCLLQGNTMTCAVGPLSSHPFFPHASPLFPLQALSPFLPLFPSSPPPLSSLKKKFPESSDIGTPYALGTL